MNLQFAACKFLVDARDDAGLVVAITDGPAQSCYSAPFVGGGMSFRWLIPALFLIACGADRATLETEVVDVEVKADGAHKDLTVTEKTAVLQQLNDICGDTWCDGDWSWSFKKVACTLDVGSCTWTALITPSGPLPKPLPTWWRSCKVTGVHAFADLVTTLNGYQTLNQNYYDASTDCVFKIEAKLPVYTP
jgi:hypothetical protein